MGHEGVAAGLRCAAPVSANFIFSPRRGHNARSSVVNDAKFVEVTVERLAASLDANDVGLVQETKSRSRTGERAHT